MSQPLDKTVTLSGQKSNGTQIELELPATSLKPTATNNITSFNRPEPDGGSRETRALNMNRIGLPVQVTASVTDAFAAKNHNGNGNRPNLDNKEDFMKELWDLFVAGTILDLKATNSKTHPEVSEFSGYLHNLDWPEEARQENSVYKVTLKLKDEVPMNQ